MAAYTAVYANHSDDRKIFGSDALLIKTADPATPGTVVAVFADISNAQAAAAALNEEA
ncbi:hypothetical protein ACWELP_25430 [Rhodococcus aetherivorans]